MLGFTAPAWRRVAWAGAYALVAFGIVAWLELPPGPPATVDERIVEPPTPTATTLSLALDSTSEVSRWTVRLDGREVAEVEATAQTWRGQASIDAEVSHELFIDVEMADEDPMQPAAVRLVVQGARDPIERLWWVEEGVLVERLVVPAGGGPP